MEQKWNTAKTSEKLVDFERLTTLPLTGSLAGWEVGLQRTEKDQLEICLKNLHSKAETEENSGFKRKPSDQPENR